MNDLYENELDITVDKHERRLDELERRTHLLEEADKILMTKIDEIAIMMSKQNGELTEIKELAFKSTPPDVTSRIQLHSLIWQILLVGVTGTGILIGILEWASRHGAGSH